MSDDTIEHIEDRFQSEMTVGTYKKNVYLPDSNEIESTIALFDEKHDCLLDSTVKEMYVAHQLPPNHANFAAVSQVRIERGGGCLVYRQAQRGTDLSVWLEQRHLTQEQRLALAERFAYEGALALHHMHAQGLVHCDTKLANIVVARADDPAACDPFVLIDFGLARLDIAATQAHAKYQITLTTSCYRAPEMIQSALVYPASDVFGLGLMLLEWAAGKRPFVEEDLTASDLEYAACFARFEAEGEDYRFAEDLVAASLAPHPILARLVQSMLCFDRARRPTARDILTILRPHVDIPRPTTPLPRLCDDFSLEGWIESGGAVYSEGVVAAAADVQIWLAHTCRRLEKPALYRPALNALTETVAALRPQQVATPFDVFLLGCGALLFVDSVLYTWNISFRALHEQARKKLTVAEIRDAVLTVLETLRFSHCILPDDVAGSERSLASVPEQTAAERARLPWAPTWLLRSDIKKRRAKAKAQAKRRKVAHQQPDDDDVADVALSMDTNE